MAEEIFCEITEFPLTFWFRPFILLLKSDLSVVPFAPFAKELTLDSPALLIFPFVAYKMVRPSLDFAISNINLYTFPFLALIT